MSAEENRKDKNRGSWVDSNPTPVQSTASDNRHSQHSSKGDSNISSNFRISIDNHSYDDKGKSWTSLIAPYPTLLNNNRDSQDSAKTDSKHSLRNSTSADNVNGQTIEKFNQDLSKNEKIALLIV